ncbi:hypothetical protein N786_01080 [Bacillus amyloliquefaciens UASWS BA1]|nr:hypothetical protein KSO_001015 [Bacillus amyloliquefaciens IT-45]ERK85101.1 hypothetical protein N786_01080 [Bacillus amyloliquefaciens UASWS BA1]
MIMKMTPFLPSFEGGALRSILSAASRLYNEPELFFGGFYTFIIQLLVNTLYFLYL